MLSEDEALAELLGLVAAGRAGLLTATGTASETATAKIRRVLPERLTRRLDAVLESLAFSAPPGERAAPESGVLLSIADAVHHHRPISIRYTAGDGGRSHRTLHPYGHVVHSGRWYVRGADPAIGEDRTFRLDRITAARTLPGSFEPPAGLDPGYPQASCMSRHPRAARRRILSASYASSCGWSGSPWGCQEGGPGCLVRGRAGSATCAAYRS